jgi:hypothetical protein
MNFLLDFLCKLYNLQILQNDHYFLHIRDTLMLQKENVGLLKQDTLCAPPSPCTVYLRNRGPGCLLV